MHPFYRKLTFIIIVLFLLMLLLLRYVFSDGLVTMSTYRQRLLSPNGSIVVSVFYEALCSDSKHFILKQLVPTYNRASGIMDVHLVPYGKATTMTNADGTYQFDCQHGPAECNANKYHACTIVFIENAQMRLDMIACMIKDNRLPRESFQRCVKQYGLDDDDIALEIQKCYDTSRGDKLLALHGEETHALRPEISFIPTITLDGAQRHQASILKDLFGEICKIAGHSDNATKICQKTII